MGGGVVNSSPNWGGLAGAEGRGGEGRGGEGGARLEGGRPCWAGGLHRSRRELAIILGFWQQASLAAVTATTPANSAALPPLQIKDLVADTQVPTLRVRGAAGGVAGGWRVARRVEWRVARRVEWRVARGVERRSQNRNIPGLRVRRAWSEAGRIWGW